ncbi:unnamed protein product, partial [Ilex paraguariensis]
KSGLFDGVFPVDGILPLATRMLLQQHTTQAYCKNKEVGVDLWRGFGVLVSGFQYWQSVSASEAASRYGVQKEGAGMLMT